jgi:signal transduction histidine kinase
MMTITSILFGMYDYFMKSESLLRKFLLESKRLFVRFISHELRTPLNAVSLGLTLIEEDLNVLLNHPIYSTLMPTAFMNQLHHCLQSLHDASENTETAIVVLNDMLQYDKIETKSLQCECEEQNLWDIIRSVCRELSLQAKASQLILTVNLQVDCDENDESWKLTPVGTLERLKAALVVGDHMKLGQVIRNLISNALKFSPPGGVVTVNGKTYPASSSCL